MQEQLSPTTASSEAVRLPLQLSEARLAARAWSATVTDKWRINHAALFSRQAMLSYGTATAPGLRLSLPFAETSGHLDPSAESLANAIGAEVSKLPLVEALHFLTSIYPALLPKNRRSELGAYYTPPCLVARLFELAGEAGFDWSAGRILDPAAGGGAFLVPAALRMRQELAGGEPAFVLAQLGHRLLGLELDAHAAWLAQASLEIALADLALESGRSLPALVRICDTIEETPAAAFDLVIGNPPYGRVTLRPDQRERFKRSLYGHANLYGVFTDVATRWAKPRGIVAFLTPTSMLGGQYFAALRRMLASVAPPVAIDFVHARRGVFEDVLQETLLALYRRGGRQRRVQIHYLDVRSECSAELTRNGTIRLPQDPGAPWLAPREPSQSRLVSRVEALPHRLRDLGYSVSTGPLVWNRFKAQLRDRPGGKGVHPLIWAESVTSGGRFQFKADKKLHKPYFHLGDRDSWLLVERPCVLVQRTTAKEQARRLIAAELPKAFIRKHGGVIVENHLNMVCAGAQPLTRPDVLAALLNSETVDQVFRCMSGSVAVSAFELEALPFPSPEALGPLVALVARRASASEVEAECRRLYGLSQ